MKELLIRTITGITLVSLVMACILLGGIWLSLLLLIIIILGSIELGHIFSVRPGIAFILSILPGASLMAFTVLYKTVLITPFWLGIPGLLLLAALLVHLTTGRQYRNALLSFTLLSFFWIALPLTFFFLTGWIEQPGAYRFRLPLIIIALTWINDMFAYLSGTLFGKHKMTPNLSPGKTWEGFFGSLILTVFSGWMVFQITQTYTPGTWILVALLIAGIGLAGDLLESRIKRAHHVKNSGNLLPGHGGILDRFDSLLIISPVLFFIFVYLNAIL
ncbi:MAG: phosphatidate cytidylyltransferase [Bacteroidales bacterium]|nr:phosphatidate cytidylyltransferase [Bacteroidales bacterium]